MAQVVEQVVAEITGLGLTRVLLWGHSSGTAFAVETARQLQERGVEVRRVFLGAQLLGDAAGRRAAVTELTGRSNAEIAARLSARQRLHRARRAGRAARRARRRRLPARLRVRAPLSRRRPGRRPPAVRLSAPVTVVVAADDPITAEYPDRHRDWQLLAEHVDLHELADGGHYFLRTRPAEAAQAVLRAAELSRLLHEPSN